MHKPQILLIFCPVWDVCAPYASLAYLAESLEGHAEVAIWDLNIEMQDFILSDKYTSHTFLEIKQNSDNRDVVKKAELLFSLVNNRIDVSKDILRSKQNTYEERKISNRLLNYARDLISLKYFPSRFTDLYFFFEHENKIPDLDSLKRNINDRRKNIFYDIFVESYAPKLFNSSFQLIGASLTGIGQVVPTLSILNQIKKLLPESRIVLGGPLLPYLDESGVLESEVLSFIDYYVIGEGEIPLLELSLGKKPKDRRIASFDSASTSLKNIIGAHPIFKLHPMQKYFSNLFVIPYVTTRECYWNKCKFCSLSSTPTYILPKNAKEIVDDIVVLYKTYNTPYFMFNDVSLPIQTFRSLSSELKRRKVKIFWSALLRFDERLTFNDFFNAYSSGCRLIQFGIESGSQRLLDEMEKGTCIENTEKILHWCKKIGIFTNCFLFVNFPTETRGDIDLTIEFLKRNSELIGNLTVGPFRLERLSEVYNHWWKYNIRSIDDEALEFSAYINFSLQDSSLNYNFKEFERIFEEKFKYATFLGLNLPDMDEYQQFFYSVCNNRQSIIDYSREKIRKIKEDTDIILLNSDFKFTIGKLKVKESEISGDTLFQKDAWIINYRPIPNLFRVNFTYAMAVIMMLPFKEAIKFSELLYTFGRYFNLDDAIGNRDLRFVLLDLYKRECLFVVSDWG